MALFPERPELFSRIRIGELRGEQTMQVVSRRLDRPRAHFFFRAPSRRCLSSTYQSTILVLSAPGPVRRIALVVVVGVSPNLIGIRSKGVTNKLFRFSDFFLCHPIKMAFALVG